ncbi:MAG TPA: D-alanine--D-alanine ligase, partial [Pilimelia sp.]|nr:D-alanine--D-alanine ligase [Pilimelia sp.]
MTDGRLRVAVLAGGASGEHDVSRASGESIAAHLDPARYDVVRVFIGRDGRWSVGAAGAPARRPRGTVADGIAAALAVLRGVDVVFPALHGVYGEDGTVQAVLDRAGVPYVGNPAPASAMGMDKVFTKRLLAAAGIPVADSVLLRGGADTLPAPDRDRLGLPAFVKPARGGSSLGVARLTDWAGLPAAVSAARCAGDRVLVEAAVAGREVDVAVLEYPDGRLVAGPPLEIRVAGGREFFDFDAKYAAGDTVFDVPARIPADAAAAVRRLAVRA